jgi:1-deoxy-D-xylulose-5-phosphate synthase
MQRAYDNIIHDIALQNLGVIFCVDRAGLCGEDGATHHGIFDAAFLNHTPNVAVYSPSSYAEFNETFGFCAGAGGIKSPVFIRYPRGAEDSDFNRRLNALNCEHNPDYIYKKNPGAKFLFISYGQISRVALEVYERLGKSGVAAEFLKLNKIKPLDGVLPEIAGSRAENIILIEEGIENGGISQSIAAGIRSGNRNKNINIKIIAIGDFITHGSNEELEDLCGFNAEKIYYEIRKYCGDTE